MNIAIHPRSDVAARRSGKRRRLSDLLAENPHVDPFPEGWFVVDFASNVKTDKLTSKKWLGEDIVYFRHPRTGEVVVTQAHCPHYGGHFDAYKKGGCVENGVITCPYHHMSFDPLNHGLVPGANISGSGRFRLKVYPTFEAYGFVLALRQRDETQPQLPKPDVSFPGVDDTDYAWGTETFGVFHGDIAVPLLANADYHHFRTVHGAPLVMPDDPFDVTEDGQISSWSFRTRERYAHEDQYRPLMGGKSLKSRQKRWLGSVAKPGREPEELVQVRCWGVGASLSKSSWFQPKWNLHLLSLLYATPIDAFSYEVFANCGVATITPMKTRMLQKMANRLGSKFHLWANIYFAKHDDLPFYTDGKIRLANPGYTPQETALKGWMNWWQNGFFSPEYIEMIEGYDLEFS